MVTKVQSLMPDMRPGCSAERKRRERPSITKRKREGAPFNREGISLTEAISSEEMLDLLPIEKKREKQMRDNNE